MRELRTSGIDASTDLRRQPKHEGIALIEDGRRSEAAHPKIT
jgi:hypothetical protein